MRSRPIPHNSLPTRRFRLLIFFTIFTAATPLAATLTTDGEQPAQSVPALTQRSEMARDGVVARYPNGWAVVQAPDTVRSSTCRRIASPLPTR